MAPAIIKAVKILYYPVPKCAGTSMRACLFEIENGFAWCGMIINGHTTHLHDYLGKAGPFQAMALPEPNWERIAIVRDPVERFLSMYRNRVLHYGDISASRMERRGVRADLPTTPDLETFVAHLAEYRKLSQSGITPIRRRIFSEMTSSIISAFFGSIASAS